MSGCGGDVTVRASRQNKMVPAFGHILIARAFLSIIIYFHCSLDPSCCLGHGGMSSANFKLMN